MGWLIPGESGRWVLYLHGNGENVSRYLSLAAALHGLGANVFLFDYRGYGESGGTSSESGLYADARAALAALRARGVPLGEIVLYGFSLGSGVAVQLATETAGGEALGREGPGREGLGGVVLEAAYTSLPAAGRHRFPFLHTSLMRNRFDSLSKIANLRAPLLMLHARDDLTVPFRQGQELFAEAPQPKRFTEIVGGHAAMLRPTPDPRGVRALGRFVLREAEK